MANNLKKTLLSALVLFLVGSIAAIADENFPGQAPDRETLRTQEKADALFEQGDFDRALFIYRKELAPRGDKYAQYMIGFMYLTGKGVPQDIIAASAWYRLAAERGHDVFVSARDELLTIFDDGARLRSDNVYRDLRRELSDVALLSGLIRDDLENLRLSSLPGSETVRSFQGLTDQRTADLEPLVERLRERLDYLIDLSLARDFDPQVEQQGVDLLESEVNREVERFESRK
jgi:hypothetical protein